MTASTLVIHLEGATPTLLQRWSREGYLPTLGQMCGNGTTSPLATRARLLPFSSTTELITGRSAVDTGIFNIYAQLRPGELRARPLTPEELPDDYWTIASQSGRHVAVIDPILAKADPSFQGLLLSGWTVHDSLFGSKAQPASLLSDVMARWGETHIPHRFHHHDQFHHHACESTPRGELAKALGAEASRKAGFVVELLRKEHWDLLVCAFSELHCAGHHLWGEAIEHEDGSGKTAGDNPLLTAYRDVDAELGKIVEATGAEATVIVVTTGGIGRRFADVALLSEIPSRLGMGPSRRLRMRANNALPNWLHNRVRQVGTQSLRNRLGLGPGSFFELRPGEKTRVFPVYNASAGAFRLNLVGREPYGTVQPGREAEEILSGLTRELLDLRVDESDEPFCERVVRVAEEFGPDAHADLPDLIVLMRIDRGPVTACTTKRLGRLRQRGNDRVTGHHTGKSHVWITGPGVSANSTLGGADLIDIAPTVLATLGVDAPAWMRGRPLIGLHSA